MIAVKKWWEKEPLRFECQPDCFSDHRWIASVKSAGYIRRCNTSHDGFVVTYRIASKRFTHVAIEIDAHIHPQIRLHISDRLKK